MNPEISPSGRLVDRLARNPLLDAPADAVQPFWKRLFSSDGLLGAPVNDALHGTWLGHSLHPVLTDVPIGAWTVAAVCDLAALVGIEETESAADIAIAVGSLGAAASALTGWAEWADTKDDPKRLGILHAGLNGVALSLYVASLVLRARNARGAGVFLALGGFGLVGAGAFLGGELSTGMHIGVRHVDIPESPPADFVAVCDDGDVAEGAMKRVAVGNVQILLSRTNGALAAIGGACTHRGAPLDEGTRDEQCVTCPWHGARFDLRSGDVVRGPATFPLTPFEARSREGRIEVRVAIPA